MMKMAIGLILMNTVIYSSFGYASCQSELLDLELLRHVSGLCNNAYEYNLNTSELTKELKNYKADKRKALLFVQLVSIGNSVNDTAAFLNRISDPILLNLIEKTAGSRLGDWTFNDGTPPRRYVWGKDGYEIKGNKISIKKLVEFESLGAQALKISLADQSLDFDGVKKIQDNYSEANINEALALVIKNSYSLRQALDSVSKHANQYVECVSNLGSDASASIANLCSQLEKNEFCAPKKTLVQILMQLKKPKEISAFPIVQNILMNDHFSPEHIEVVRAIVQNANAVNKIDPIYFINAILNKGAISNDQKNSLQNAMSRLSITSSELNILINEINSPLTSIDPVLYTDFSTYNDTSLAMSDSCWRLGVHAAYDATRKAKNLCQLSNSHREGTCELSSNDEITNTPFVCSYSATFQFHAKMNYRSCYEYNLLKKDR